MATESITEDRLRFFHDMFEELYSIRLHDFGIRISLESKTHIFEFDPHKAVLIIDIKFIRSPNIIRNKLKNVEEVLFNMLHKGNLMPHKKLAKLFYAMFPTYKVEHFGSMALAFEERIGLLHFTRVGKQFENPPECIYGKRQFHQVVKSYIIPLRFSSTQVKPIECLSAKTITYANTVNEALEKVGYEGPDIGIFVTQRGVILDTDEQAPLILSYDGKNMRRGNKTSPVYKEYKLYLQLLQ